MRNRTIYDLVRKLLEQKPVLRNSDKKLCWAVWMQLGFADATHMSLESFLDPKTPPIESITRARRKVQENFPLLMASKEVVAQRRFVEHYKGNQVYLEEV